MDYQNRTVAMSTCQTAGVDLRGQAISSCDSQEASRPRLRQ